MKFSDMDASAWEERRPYMDTCLLPVTGLTGSEQPWQAKEALERLRDYMIELERRFKGRMVTYPAFHYWGGPDHAKPLDELCSRLRLGAGFRFIVLVSAAEELTASDKPSGADLLLLSGEHPLPAGATGKIEAMWSKGDQTKI